VQRYSVELLRAWQFDAENKARRDLGRPTSTSNDPAWLPLYLPMVEPSDRGRLSFTTRTIPFVGRIYEQGIIDNFLHASAQFLWMPLSGPAGSGKSRLMLEYCLGQAAQWGRAGFLEPDATQPDWYRWQPPERTLITVDYPLAHVEVTRDMLLALSKRTDLRHRVRVVLLDRIVGDAWERRLFGGGTPLLTILQYKYPDALHLDSLDVESAKALQAALLADTGLSMDNTAEDCLASSETRSLLPLFLAMSAYAVSEGRRGAVNWRPEQLIGDWLHRERERFWGPSGVTESEERLICLACISGAVGVDLVFGDAYAGCHIDFEHVRTSRYQIITGIGVDSFFDPLVPDILGEYLVLETLLSSGVNHPYNRALLQAAWEHSAEKTASFMLRVMQDFPNHAATLAVLRLKPIEASHEFWSRRPSDVSLSTAWLEMGIAALWSLVQIPVGDNTRTEFLDALSLVTPDHLALPMLRRWLGDVLFDDPTEYSGSIILDAPLGGYWDYAASRELALRLSDIRWSLATYCQRSIQALRELPRADNTLNRVATVAQRLLERDWRDRRARSSLGWCLVDYLTIENGDGSSLKMAWNALRLCFERAAEYQKEDKKLGGRPQENDDELFSLLSAGTAYKSKTDHLSHPLASVYEVFVQEPTRPTEFLEIYSKATVNLATVAMRHPELRLADLAELRKILEILCVSHQGAEDLGLRIYEIAVGEIKMEMEAQNIDAAENVEECLVETFRKMRKPERFLPIAKSAAVGGRLQAFLARGELKSAMSTFDGSADALGVPTRVPELAVRAVAESLANLASLAFDRGLTEDGLRYARLLLRLGRTRHAKLPVLRRGVNLMLRNLATVSWRDGNAKSWDLITKWWVAELEKRADPEHCTFALDDCARRIEGGGADKRFVRRIVDLTIAVINRACVAEEVSEWQKPVRLCQMLARALVDRREPDAVRLLVAFSALVEKRFDPVTSEVLLQEIGATISQLREPPLPSARV
jgi:hypothetical protein